MKIVILRVLQWNAQSIVPKMPELDYIFNNKLIHIVIVQETLLYNISPIKLANYLRQRQTGWL